MGRAKPGRISAPLKLIKRSPLSQDAVTSQASMADVCAGAFKIKGTESDNVSWSSDLEEEAATLSPLKVMFEGEIVGEFAKGINVEDST